MADMRGLVINKPEWSSHQEFAQHGVPAGTGFSMTIADQMNRAARHCRIGRIVLKSDEEMTLPKQKRSALYWKRWGHMAQKVSSITVGEPIYRWPAHKA